MIQRRVVRLNARFSFDTDSVVIWFKNGNTALFQKVRDFKQNDDFISFKYSGISTGVNRQAYFDKISIAGFAYQIK